MKFCTNCGAKLPEDVKFCMECGAKIETDPQASAEVQQPTVQQPTVQETPAVEAPAAPKMPEQRAFKPYTFSDTQQGNAPLPRGYTPPQAEQMTQTEVQTGSYTPPPKAEKPAGAGFKGFDLKGIKLDKKMLTYIGAGAAALLLIILLISLIGGGKADPAVLGSYECVSMRFGDMTVDPQGELLELEKKGKAVLTLGGEDFKGKWSLKDEAFTLKQGGDKIVGTLEDGVIVLELEGIEYTFASQGAKPASGSAANTPAQTKPEATKAPETKPAQKPGFSEPAQEQGPAAYKAISCTTSGYTMDASMLATMGDCYVILNGDGTGTWKYFDQDIILTYTDDALIAGGISMPYTIDGDTMTFTLADSTSYTLEKTDEMPADKPAASAPTGVQAWAGDWYGWWIIDTVWEGNSELEGQWWDCCASLEIEPDGTAQFTLWDEDYTRAEPLAQTGMTVSETAGVARFISEEGFFNGRPVAHGDWLCYSDATEYGDVMTFDGEYDDGELRLWYTVYLRPWGTDWSDIEADDPDLLPYYYEDWYLPLIDSGVTQAPDHIGG